MSDAAIRKRNETGRKVAGPDSPLFREVVLEEQRPQWLGTILVEPKIVSSKLIYYAYAAAILVVLFAIFGSYTRKQTVHGWLVPDRGVARIVAPKVGTVTELHVIEGQKVKRGAPLLTLTSELQTQKLGTAHHEVVRRLELRRDSMAAQRDVEADILNKKETELDQRASAIRDERESLKRQIKLQQEALAISEKTLKSLSDLRTSGYISERRYQRTQKEVLQESSRLETLKRSLSALDRQSKILEREISQLPLQRKSKLSEVERSVATLDQQLIEAESRREIVITAPRDGTVTSIQTEPGGSVNTHVPLLSIVPLGAKFQAHLFTPSRAVGFAHKGQAVRMRYHAFPYQKFGTYEGVVASVSRAAVSPTELPQKLQSLPSADTAGKPEPVYRVVVDLKRQTAQAYGKKAPLQAGMQLEADLIIEKRRLYEWVLDPLYTLTGR